MNQGKVWRVVKPTVGVPVYLGAVAVTALILHGGLLAKTDWFGAYWNGGKKAAAAAAAVAPAPVAAPQAPAQ
ncbi:light-harvesting protein [Rubrivivax gelatinosus]|jgi:light-harvesting protein B-800-850 alpha chain|uniref:Light-harvesting protein B-800/850 alpha chain n=2 Tax=Rubrivivax gelatinosus TaxID=28068 RepID=LHA2_RUBGE|nr:light-harvesting protein [Rubrivivax gelatinosus]P77799.1 RecName: Full=Light-harvesting protein B-800/850 alpha chain; AltName: Full=Antenna pigment protein alpha chain; AltName: Full=LH2 alpha polypeptide [Rubrivivax gelatinosus]AAB49631.1 light-harvesting B800-850 alpha polypeptide [Rubrivivax gelatinosus]AAB49634.1 light-harvesting B800-850 alpha polypeptide [Rubrivivax gelatinosus]MBK1615851.1 light-harvesting protein [Rubrivivax gelatinosus]MBK1688576.1 light-harvesting protein [Rubri